jgi:hypothetical protein
VGLLDTPAIEVLLEVTDDGSLTRLGQICFFLVNTSQYSLVAVFQEIWIPQFYTQDLDKYFDFD